MPSIRFRRAAFAGVLASAAVFAGADARTRAPEFLPGCQGEGCGSCTYYDKPAETAFKLYEKQDARSPVLMDVPQEHHVRLEGASTKVLARGRSVVMKIRKKTPGLRVGDRLDTLWDSGEGEARGRKGGKWVDFEKEDVVLRRYSPPRYEVWFEIAVGDVKGFSNVEPFNTFCG